MRSILPALALGAATLGVAGCGGGSAVPGAALDSFTTDELTAHVAVLAADSLGGRGPSSVGEDRTMAYLESQATALGAIIRDLRGY